MLPGMVREEGGHRLHLTLRGNETEVATGVVMIGLCVCMRCICRCAVCVSRVCCELQPKAQDGCQTGESNQIEFLS